MDNNNSTSSAEHWFKTNSTEIKTYSSGMKRDTDTNKPRYDLIPPELLKRLAELYARGAVKYGDNNWRKANTQEEYDRMKASAWRHFVQWSAGWDTEEDHAVGAIWNIIAYEWHTQHKNNSFDLKDTLKKIEYYSKTQYVTDIKNERA